MRVLSPTKLSGGRSHVRVTFVSTIGTMVNQYVKLTVYVQKPHIFDAILGVHFLVLLNLQEFMCHVNFKCNKVHVFSMAIHPVRHHCDAIQ